MNKTAIQQAIDNIKKHRDIVHNQYLVSNDCSEMEEISNQLAGLDFSIKTITALLPTEQEQIEQAYEQCVIDTDNEINGHRRQYQNAKQYYNETYKTEE
jgi:Holliday junction resolvasome RuvABC ATP-dependent DNA helicase subunit